MACDGRLAKAAGVVQRLKTVQGHLFDCHPAWSSWRWVAAPRDDRGTKRLSGMHSGSVVRRIGIGPVSGLAVLWMGGGNSLTMKGGLTPYISV